jgi:hypothetical protein
LHNQTGTGYVDGYFFILKDFQGDMWEYSDIQDMVKLKVKLSLFLTKYHATKTYLLHEAPGYEDVLGDKGIAPRILNLCTRWV